MKRVLSEDVFLHISLQHGLIAAVLALEGFLAGVNHVVSSEVLLVPLDDFLAKGTLVSGKSHSVLVEVHLLMC